jgi:hypothetical protein
MHHLSLGALRANALFVSGLQRSGNPSADQVRKAVDAAIRKYGDTGCAARAAQEFGDHPETAVIRMRWAIAVVWETFADSAPDLGQRPATGPLVVVRPGPADEISDISGRAA